jgi:hypothetical protein
MYSSPLVSADRWRGGQDIDGQWDTHRQYWLSFCSQLNLQTAEQGLRNLFNYFVTQEDKLRRIFHLKMVIQL